MATVVAFVAALGLAFIFSVVAIAIILVGGTLAWIYFWWNTRDLRKQMRDYPHRGVMREGEIVEGDVVRGEIIEGEVIRVVDDHEEK